MEKIVLFLIVICIFVLFLIRVTVDNKRNIEKLRKKFQENFGNSNTRVWKSGEMERISYYANNKKSQQTIDEITWNDLDMDLIYQQMAYTKSSLGDDYLYYLLKNPVMDVQLLEEREGKIASLTDDQNSRVELQVLFERLGRVKEYSLSKYFEYLMGEKPRSNVKHYIVDVLIVSSLLIMIYNVGFGLLLFFFLILYNIVSYFRDKAYFEPYLVSVRYLFRILDLAKEVVVSLPQVWMREKEEIADILASMNKVRKNSYLVMSPGRMNGEGLELILDYLRMCLHLDIIKFNRMLSGLQQYESQVWKLYEIMGEIDACIAIACYRASMEHISTPEFVQKREIEMISGYHPLIENPVSNSLVMDKNVLLTGSNASGKSTFLKTMGVNVILAQTIHTCLADKFRMPFCKIYTSMSIKDSIILKESYYMAEIKAMKRILDSADKGNMVVCMVDEVLRGTNTVERIAASTQILKSLASANVLCMAATHDVELTKTLEKEYDNYHFEESMEKEDVQFSYRLKAGRANSSNAINLLEHLGYDDTLVRKAREMVDRFEQQGEWICG